jgi:hypothetical protein
VKFAMFRSVLSRGGVPVRMAYSSAGNPKASKPIGCITVVPRIRSNRATMSVAV